MRERFLKQGFIESSGFNSDWCVINTCTVTSSADAKSRNIIRHVIRKNPNSRILVTGCLAAGGRKSLAGIEGIDYIVTKDFFADSISDFKGRNRAFIKIQDGCDNFCSYCKVPYVRGRSRSRAENEILNEAVTLVEKGFKEIVLTGICLGSYPCLVKLLRKLEKIPGLLRIRLSSIEAGDVSSGLVNAIKKSDKLCPHLHIPIQSGDDAILKRMRRGYTRKHYLGLIQRVKKEIKGLAVTTDVIVGFPGETQDQFNNTVSLVRTIKPLKVHIFPYSHRPATYAAKFPGQVPLEIIKDRVNCLTRIAQDLSLSFRREFINKDADVLIEGTAKFDPGYWEGFTRNYIKVMISKKAGMRGNPVPVKLKKIADSFVFAEPCDGRLDRL
jgi:threonylcarbamoyladenosine tRNA methylthiotransferase MtaB